MQRAVSIPPDADYPGRWHTEFRRLKNDSIALVGDSRILAAVDVEHLSKSTKKSVVQLGITGSSPMPVLRKLSENKLFSGTIVVGVSPGILFHSPLTEKKSLSWVKWPEQQNLAAKIESYLENPLRLRFSYTNGNHQVRWILLRLSDPLRVDYRFLRYGKHRELSLIHI